MSETIDLAGNILITENIRVGATSPGQTGTDISSAELTFLDGAATTNAGTNKAMITGTSGALTVAGVATFAVSPVFSTAITAATITTATLTTVTPTTIAGTPNFTGAPTFASTSTFIGSPTFNGDPIIGVGKTINLDSSSKTLSSNAVTLTTYATQVTSESLTTAAGASQAFVLSMTGLAATDYAFVTRAGGTNTRKNFAYDAVMTSNTCTVTLYNNEPTNAINGTVIFNLWIVKA